MPSARLYQARTLIRAHPKVTLERLATGGGPIHRSGPPSDDDRAVAARPERLEVVAAADRLDLETGLLGHRPDLLRADEPQPVDAQPPRRRLPGAPLLVDRREGHGLRRGVVLCGADLRHGPAGCRVDAAVLEDHPAVEAGEIVGVGEPHVDGRDAAG